MTAWDAGYWRPITEDIGRWAAHIRGLEYALLRGSPVVDVRLTSPSQLPTVGAPVELGLFEVSQRIKNLERCFGSDGRRLASLKEVRNTARLACSWMDAVAPYARGFIEGQSRMGQTITADAHTFLSNSIIYGRDIVRNIDSIPLIPPWAKWTLVAGAILAGAAIAYYCCFDRK